MQTTSALYKSILAGDNHWFENRLVIDNVGTFGETDLFSIETSNNAVNGKPEIGKAVAGEISVKMLMPSSTIPRMATLRPSVRVCNATQQSEWIAQGVYFIDTREVTNNDDGLNILTIHGYDAMMKAEQGYPNTSHDWPYRDSLVVAEIASAMGVTVDSRTNAFITSGYMIDLPLGYTMRETLEHIAVMYAGNFVMSNEGKLLFVPLFGLNAEEWLTGSYLSVEGSTDALTFGNEGWYILV